MSQVRVRFAPSPTGFFHIGSARTALFNWLYARHTGGVFVLRIEDTDAARNTEEFLKVIYNSLTWLGLNWDEGPKVDGCGGGDFGPYRQSERAPIYREYLEKLKAAGRTYEKDGAIWFKLLGDRHEVFDEHRKKTVTKVKNTPAVIDDLIRGRVERLEDEDFVIVRSDGNPVFHLVNVVDDIAMRITHVIRGEDHLSNTSKHVELFKAFGAPVPAYAHIPLILKQNGPGKMSKRDQGALIEEYQRRGFLPEALVNFLCLLGWNPGDDREKMPIAEIIRLFDLPGVNQSNARFDEKKLAHMNMAYLQDLHPDQFLARAREYFLKRAVFLERKSDELKSFDPRKSAIAGRNAAYFRNALASQKFDDVMMLVKPKIKGLDDIMPPDEVYFADKEIHEIPAYTVYFFSEKYPETPGLRQKILAKGDPANRLRELAQTLSIADFSSDTLIEEAIKVLAAGKGLGFGDYQAVARLALSGTNVGPSITSMMRVLGRERVLERLQRFVTA